MKLTTSIQVRTRHIGQFTLTTFFFQQILPVIASFLSDSAPVFPCIVLAATVMEYFVFDSDVFNEYSQQDCSGLVRISSSTFEFHRITYPLIVSTPPPGLDADHVIVNDFDPKLLIARIVGLSTTEIYCSCLLTA